MKEKNRPTDTSENKTIPWHRLFGLTLTDYFTDSPYEVELEKDLSLKQQLLDVVIIEKGEGQITDPLPDGLEVLGTHNLMTYKSHQERLDGWTVEELYGHYVNYRKQISPSFNKLMPARNFRLFAVSARYPEKLAGRIRFTEVGEGVYDLRWGIRDIRVIVLNRIPKTERNAAWLLFSADAGKVGYGREHYRLKSPVSSIINMIFEKYQQEGIIMAYTMDDFEREVKEKVINRITLEDFDEIVNKLGSDKVLRRFKTEDRLKGLKPEDRLKGLKPEEIEEIEAYLKKIKG